MIISFGNCKHGVAHNLKLFTKETGVEFSCLVELNNITKKVLLLVKKQGVTHALDLHQLCGQLVTMEKADECCRIGIKCGCLGLALCLSRKFYDKLQTHLEMHMNKRFEILVYQALE
jgi:hypothetical protein